MSISMAARFELSAPAFNAPKTIAGGRIISIPSSIIAELRGRWRLQQEQRLALGMGKPSPEDLVFARADGSPWPPDSLTTAWQKTIAARKLPKVNLHALRHTHVGQLIASGLGVVTVSRRIGKQPNCQISGLRPPLRQYRRTSRSTVRQPSRPHCRDENEPGLW
jgi:hypothetical protein